jgi:hypothetical protein
MRFMGWPSLLSNASLRYMRPSLLTADRRQKRGEAMAEPNDDLLEEVSDCLGLSRAEVEALLPGPISKVSVDAGTSVRWFAAGDPYLVLIGLAEDVACVGEPRVTWEGAHTPRLEARNVVEFGVEGGRRTDAIGEAIRSTTSGRLATFRRCGECGELTPPEWLHSPTLCDGCAERHHGVIH